MNHLEFAESESAALGATAWDLWIKETERMAPYYEIGRGETGSRGSCLDGDQDEDGYSMDGALDAFRDGKTPAEYLLTVQRNIRRIQGYDRALLEGRLSAIREVYVDFDPAEYKTEWLESHAGNDFLDGVHRVAIKAELDKRYDETERRLAKAMADLESTVRALVVSGLLLAWGTYGFLPPVSDATASLVRQAKGAVSKANPLGKVRQGLTDYQAGLEAERDRWLAPLEDIS